MGDTRVDDLLARLERERLEADRLYNDALTALDQALVAPPALPAMTDSAGGERASRLNTGWDILPGGGPPAGRGLRGLFHGLVWRIAGPPLQAQQQFNAALVDHLNRSDRAEEARSKALVGLVAALGSTFDGLVRFEALLLHYLRTITQYVDSKDRSLAGPDLRERLALTEQRLSILKREFDRLSQPADRVAAPAGAGDRAPIPAAFTAPVDSAAYVGFEDRFRGSSDAIRSRVEEYLHLFAPPTRTPVLDIGCGRGELLELLRAGGVVARGVDTNHAMVDRCRTRGLEVEQDDALAYLARQGDASLGGVAAIQVVEHFTPEYLLKFLEALYHKLSPGAPLVLETVNPACWFAFFETYLRDPTHQRALHPETLRYLVEASGFSAVDVRFLRPVPDGDRLDRVAVGQAADGPAWAALAAAVNAHADKLNARLFSSVDYVVIARR